MADIEFKKSLLLKEYERLCVEVRLVEANIEKAIAFGLSIVTASFAVGVAQHVHEVFFVIPVAIGGVFFYATMLYTYIFSIGGYKRHVEDQLNEIAEEKILIWEELVSIRQRNNIIRPVLIAIYVLVGSILVALSVNNLITYYGVIVGILMLVTTLSLFVILLFALRSMTKTYDHTYRNAVALRDSGRLSDDG